LAFGLIVTVAPWLLFACQGQPTQPVTVTATPAARSTQLATAVAVPTATPAQPTVASATATREHALASTGTPAPSQGAQPTPSHQRPASSPPVEPHAGATQPANSPGQAQSSGFYELNGLTLEYYWPLDERSNLSADETEILAYNEGDSAIEFLATRMTFTESGRIRAQSSGTWEKYPSRFSWDRIEYISIPPSSYNGEPLLVQPGEKARIHWHLESVTSAVTDQSVALDCRPSAIMGHIGV
jgi:hypothetical protein